MDQVAPKFVLCPAKPALPAIFSATQSRGNAHLSWGWVWARVWTDAVSDAIDRDPVVAGLAASADIVGPPPRFGYRVWDDKLLAQIHRAMFVARQIAFEALRRDGRLENPAAQAVGYAAANRGCNDRDTQPLRDIYYVPEPFVWQEVQSE